MNAKAENGAEPREAPMAGLPTNVPSKANGGSLAYPERSAGYREIAQHKRAVRFEAFLISLSFFATTCLAVGKMQGLMELSWPQVFGPVIGYAAIVVFLNLAARGIVHFGIWWQARHARRVLKMAERIIRLDKKMRAEIERIGRECDYNIPKPIKVDTRHDELQMASSCNASLRRFSVAPELNRDITMGS